MTFWVTCGKSGDQRVNHFTAIASLTSKIVWIRQSKRLKWPVLAGVMEKKLQKAQKNINPANIIVLQVNFFSG